ncbi:MAG: isopentenyl phosphate kinase family protein [Candidatus Micrarchaeota archaeon]|nr:isopentenyl phosphate kinase family protein [Candidatus Micrarchaeota archaeon]
MGKLYFLKIGGSAITYKNRPRKAKMQAIRRILSQVKKAKAKGKFDLVIGHGSGSFAHIPAKRYRINEGIINRQSRRGAALTHLVAKELNTIIVSEGLRMGLELFPFSPSSFGMWRSDDSGMGSADAIKEAIKHGFIPVVYGDVVMHSGKGVSIASTEDVFTFLAEHLNPSRIILATDVDGVFDKDPKVYADAKLIRMVDSENAQRVLNYASGSTKIDVTGGMRTKLASLHAMVKKAKSEGMIINCGREDSVADALTGKRIERCTIIRG